MGFLGNVNWTNGLCKKIGLGLAAFLLLVLAITVHSPKASKDKQDSSSDAGDSSSQADNRSNYDTIYVKLDNRSVNNSGSLVLDNKDHSYVANVNDLVTVYQYLFNEKGEQVMSTSSTAISGTKEMMEHLNAMVSDFASNTGLKTIMVLNGTYLVDGKLYMTQFDMSDDKEDEQHDKPVEPEKDNLSSNGCYEHLTGLAVDLQLYEADKGTYPEFTGEGEYAWINENCWKYGFVLRYPAGKQQITGVEEKKNHYRYVGEVYAQIMHENDLALEELYGFIGKHTYQDPIIVNAANGKSYMVYSAVLDTEKTASTVAIPDTGEGAEERTFFTGIDDTTVYVCAELSAVQKSEAQTDSSNK